MELSKKTPFETTCPLCGNRASFCGGIACNNCTKFIPEQKNCKQLIKNKKCKCDFIDMLNSMQTRMIDLEIEINNNIEEKIK